MGVQRRLAFRDATGETNQAALLRGQERKGFYLLNRLFIMHGLP
jgi:hypothetical protein